MSRVRHTRAVVGSNLRGNRGEFFTPRNICRMAVRMLDPTENSIIFDTCMRHGRFPNRGDELREVEGLCR